MEQPCITAFNLQPLAGDKLTGIGFYAKNTLNSLLSDPLFDSSELQVFDFLSRNNAVETVRERIDEKYRSKPISVVKSLPLGAYIRMGNAGKAFSYEKMLRSKADTTVFFNYLYPKGVRGKRIITIYDMVCSRFPQTMDDRNRILLQRHLKPCAEEADAIVTISDFSKKEIVELLHVDSAKVFVAPCGVDSSFYCPSSTDEAEAKAEREYLSKIGLSSSFVLYVGTLEPRKNVSTLIRAFEKAASLLPATKLVLAGGVGWHSEDTMKLISDSPVKDRIVQTGYVTDVQKRALFRACKVFVFPSLYEGFGMPVSEAMACGTNVICSNSSSLPEVSSNKAILLDPMDVEGFASSIVASVEGKAVSYTKAELSLAVSKYTWEKTAQGFMNALNYVRS